MFTMKPEDQVVSLDLAKRLEYLGLQQASLWYWVREDNGAWTLQDVDSMPLGCYAVAAFTVAEMAHLLPTDVKGHNWRVWKTNHVGAYELKYRKRVPGVRHPVILRLECHRKMADAMGQMLCWLLENNLIV